jgi:hypothetical protein
VAWHVDYEDPSSALTARLRAVRHHLSHAVDRAPAGPIRVLSLCAGQGHDVVGVLAGHERRDDVWATLVELDFHNVDRARQGTTEANLNQVEVRHADASHVVSFADVLPADVLLLCGIFGNISDADIDRTIEATPTLCSAGATVIWTRHRRPPDYTDHIRQVFQTNGFDEIAFEAPDTAGNTGVGVNRLRESSPEPPPDAPLFLFTR